MTVLNVYNLQKEKVSDVELKKEIFNVPIKKHVLHDVVISQLSSHRRGTVATKNRSEVKCSGTKLYRQKGTGRARVGSGASPTRRGGGVTFGPVPRKYVNKVHKKVKKAALYMALTDKAKAGQLIVVNDFDLPEIKTKNFVKLMKNFDVNKALIVTQNKVEKLEKSSKNVPWIKIMKYQGLNVYDILKYDYLFLELSALGKIQEAFAS